MTWGSRACMRSARPAPRMADASRWIRQLTLEGPKNPSSVAIGARQSRAGARLEGSDLGPSARAGGIGHRVRDFSRHHTQLETVDDHGALVLLLHVQDPAGRHPRPQGLRPLCTQLVQGPGDIGSMGCEPGRVVGIRLIDRLIAFLTGWHSFSFPLEAPDCPGGVADCEDV